MILGRREAIGGMGLGLAELLQRRFPEQERLRLPEQQAFRLPPDLTSGAGLTGGWINVMDFGARGDSVTADTQAILSAVQVAAARYGGGKVVFFPRPPVRYRIAQPLALPPISHGWVVLLLDGVLELQGGPIEPESFYQITGITSGGPFAFSKSAHAAIIVQRPIVGPAILIRKKSAVRIENVSVRYMLGESNGIEVHDCSDVTLKGVHVAVAGDNTTGVPLVIRGGFNYRIEECGLNPSSLGDAPSILLGTSLETPHGPGTIHISRSFIVHNGVKIALNPGGNGLSSLFMEQNLFEAFKTALLTIDAPGMFVGGILLIQNQMADPAVGPPFPPLIANRGNNVRSVMAVFNNNFGPFVSGDPIQGLEVWPLFQSTHGEIGQSSNYIVHWPDRLDIGMPVRFLDTVSLAGIGQVLDPLSTLRDKPE